MRLLSVGSWHFHRQVSLSVPDLITSRGFTLLLLPASHSRVVCSAHTKSDIHVNIYREFSSHPPWPALPCKFVHASRVQSTCPSKEWLIYFLGSYWILCNCKSPAFFLRGHQDLSGLQLSDAFVVLVAVNPHVVLFAGHYVSVPSPSSALLWRLAFSLSSLLETVYLDSLWAVRSVITDLPIPNPNPQISVNKKTCLLKLKTVSGIGHLCWVRGGKANFSCWYRLAKREAANATTILFVQSTGLARSFPYPKILPVTRSTQVARGSALFTATRVKATSSSIPLTLILFSSSQYVCHSLSVICKWQLYDAWSAEAKIQRPYSHIVNQDTSFVEAIQWVSGYVYNTYPNKYHNTRLWPTAVCKLSLAGNNLYNPRVIQLDFNVVILSFYSEIVKVNRDVLQYLTECPASSLRLSTNCHLNPTAGRTPPEPKAQGWVQRLDLFFWWLA